MRLTYYDERVIDQLAARTHLTGEQNVVDVGTGTGFVAAGLAARRRTDTAREGLRGLFTLAALVGHAMDGGLAELGLSRARGEVIWTLHHQGAMTRVSSERRSSAAHRTLRVCSTRWSRRASSDVAPIPTTGARRWSS